MNMIEIESIVKQYVEVLNQRISQKWEEVDQGIFTERNISVNYSSDSESIEVKLEYGGMGAFILEYGSGSAMVTHTADTLGSYGNPAYSHYIGSETFNTDRLSKGNAFLGRDKGDTVYTPTGARYQSTGRMKGINLEKHSNPYKPQLPMHIIETEIIHWKDELGQALDKAIKESIEMSILGAFMGDI